MTSASDGQSDLRDLLQLLAQGDRTVDQVHQELSATFPRIAHSPLAKVQSSELDLDLDRAQRCGFPEVIYAPGKSREALHSAFELLLSQKQNALATRCDPAQAAELCASFPRAKYNAVARTVRIDGDDSSNETRCCSAHVGVVTAGTSDRPVAEEAVETLRWMKVNTDLIIDAGVAGPQRFLRQKHRLERSQAVIVVAGMEGALPSVVAGWVSCPVIAVPTSVGYGAALGGIAALLGMLNSCAANVAVVNIDAGFKAGYLAGMIARQAAADSPIS